MKLSQFTFLFIQTEDSSNENPQQEEQLAVGATQAVGEEPTTIAAAAPDQESTVQPIGLQAEDGELQEQETQLRENESDLQQSELHQSVLQQPAVRESVPEKQDRPLQESEQQQQQQQQQDNVQESEQQQQQQDNLQESEQQQQQQQQQQQDNFQESDQQQQPQLPTQSATFQPPMSPHHSQTNPDVESEEAVPVSLADLDKQIATVKRQLIVDHAARDNLKKVIYYTVNVYFCNFKIKIKSAFH